MIPTKTLDRFIDAQDRDYAQALREIQNGKKQGHWIWYIFPQLKGLGYSETSKFYAINDVQEATDYLTHPVLGSRLIEISNALLATEGRSALQIMGRPDDAKLRSSMTLFGLVEDADPVFQAVLETFFNGRADRKTLMLTGRET